MPTPLTELPVRRLTTADLHVCANLSEDRGWPREEHKWGLLLAAGKGYGIDAPDAEGLAAGCVVTSYGPELSAVGMVLVAERYARLGVGRRLMRHVLAEAGDTPLTLHSTPNGQSLYEELGFAHAGRAEMVRGRFRLSGPAPGAATRPATAEDLPAILRLDAEVFGVDRTHMLARLPAFADQLRVAEAGDVLTGYAAAWPNMGTRVVGPLIARDTDTAKSLVASLAEGAEHPLRADIDVRHRELLAWLKASGLEPIAFNAVMLRGTPALPGDWTRRFAPLTVAAG
ncbi:GNAT family N-acetyltransferase [Streptomyces spongiicola]|uniref:GNAT family N-acetyltransferase n=1 Tax=Streptomyces spongiicola TaxID=1690221 RepID=A0A2S1Z163_9ACTN|nr:GNAT family N-acetyltransferase [Streptomyces spongiicola]AWK10089.1 GNAT family N-acetyltransferase [Streptomyces spongiicola]GBQ00957.1 GNAT family N-acetyltransferase [Streptomyces spongiicola]